MTFKTVAIVSRWMVPVIRAGRAGSQSWSHVPRTIPWPKRSLAGNERQVLLLQLQEDTELLPKWRRSLRLVPGPLAIEHGRHA